MAEHPIISILIECNSRVYRIVTVTARDQKLADLVAALEKLRDEYGWLSSRLTKDTEQNGFNKGLYKAYLELDALLRSVKGKE